MLLAGILAQQCEEGGLDACSFQNLDRIVQIVIRVPVQRQSSAMASGRRRGSQCDFAIRLTVFSGRSGELNAKLLRRGAQRRADARA